MIYQSLVSACFECPLSCTTSSRAYGDVEWYNQCNHPEGDGREMPNEGRPDWCPLEHRPITIGLKTLGEYLRQAPPRCKHERIVVRPADDTFHEQRGCLDCNQWLDPVRLKRP